jgi:2-phosphosulfolactate phosphatase
MRIHTGDFVEGARSARGVAIIIDVFRACSLIAHALAAGAARVVPVADIDTARALKAHWPDALLVGERHARPLPGFDCGNSPSQVLAQALAGRTLIHTTHAGTQGLIAATRVADRVFTGALVNVSATVAAVRALAPEEVTIVAMGHEARERCAEDDLCRDELLRRLSADEPMAVTDVALSAVRARVRQQLRMAPAAVKFFDPLADWAPEADFELCTEVDGVPFAVALQRLATAELPAQLPEEVAWSLVPWGGVPLGTAHDSTTPSWSA